MRELPYSVKREEKKRARTLTSRRAIEISFNN
jgi:hypothetical protein